jgi:Predicted acetyltransferase
MFDLLLVEVSKKYEKQAMEYRQDFIFHGEKLINGSSGFIHYQNYDEWLRKIELEKCKEASQEDTPATTYFTIRIDDKKIIGSIQLRHHLTEELKKDGGNIGYGICPSERGKGYGTQQLALVLLQAQALQIQKVMISCDKSNRASAKVAINNGGILSGEGFDEESESITEIYWIDLM